jgi:hypothetical protein
LAKTADFEMAIDTPQRWRDVAIVEHGAEEAIELVNI